MSKNVILTDYDVSDTWDYKVALENETCEKWEIRKCITNRLHGSKSKELLRYIRYFTFSFSVFFERNRYDKIIAWQQFYGIILALYCAIFRVKKTFDIYVMTFIYKPKKNKLYSKMMKYVIKSGYITKFIVLSDSEIEYYSNLFDVSKECFFSTRIGVPDSTRRISTNNNGEKYYLSVGRSNRDYAFLRDAWKKEYGKLIIVCDSYKEDPKDGIECIYGCYGDEYLKLVANCYAEIIALKDDKISSGSLSFLQAMMMSKPTIVTENITVHDYITSGENGFIIPKSIRELERIIKLLDNDEIYSRVCSQARRTYEQNYSETALGKHIGGMIKRTR